MSDHGDGAPTILTRAPLTAMKSGALAGCTLRRPTGSVLSCRSQIDAHVSTFLYSTDTEDKTNYNLSKMNKKEEVNGI